MVPDAVPKTQTAWIVSNRGHPSQALILKKDYPVPSTLKRGEVLVKVHAAALNPVGWKVMRILPNFIARRPHVAEHDLAGIIADPNGTDFKKGDEVFGWLPVPLTIKTGQGALAQYARVPADHLVLKPSNVDFVQASGVALAGLTALLGIRHATVEAGQTVFVNGGTTAVGSFAIQIAKAKGCRVVATCSTPNVDIVKELGADEVIDYKTTPVVENFKRNSPSPRFHAVYDTVGLSADLFTSSPLFLAPNGVFISVGVSSGGMGNIVTSFMKTTLWPAWLGGTKRKHKTISVANKKEALRTLHELIAEGKVKPLVDSVYALEDVPKAYDRIMTSRAKGKVIVKIVE